ncbi:hypothetical protein GWK47_040762 [Chionoecetes opilio]|uniref:Uncharacterized protein n=1 Tax=Chionoecetes opilio TaxID=41210 RepID=A0A8J5CZR9_CHIOP|nr:hypothetical protein GWK47_040762 [Chionoecetes opilio]
MAAGNQKQASSEFLLNPNANTLQHARFEAVVSKTEGDDLVPDARLSTSFKTTGSHVLPVESELAGTPRRNSASSSPGGGWRCGPPYRQRGTGGVFRPQSRANLSGISRFRSSRIFSGLALPRNSCSFGP